MEDSLYEIATKSGYAAEGWKPFLTDSKDILDDIEKQVYCSSDVIFPKKENVMRFMKVLNPKDIKYVFVGIDPYPSCDKNTGEPDATGRSFEVAYLTNWSKPLSENKGVSLINILKVIYKAKYMNNRYSYPLKIESIRKKIDNNEFKISQPKDWFDKVERQGVLWLNAALTIPKGAEAGKHLSIWKPFLEQLCAFLKDTNPNVKWLLLGEKTNEQFGSILDKDHIIGGTHPSVYKFVKEFDLIGNTNGINWYV